MICECPAAKALTTIPVADCPENFGQIQKIAFQRLYSEGTTKNGFKGMEEAAGGDITKLASWTPQLAAMDGKKIVISPFVQAPETTPGDPITFGGGNETLGGIEIVTGRGGTAFTSIVRQTPQSVIKAMKALQCESQAQNLGVYLFNENGAIGCIKVGEGDYAPIPIRSLFIGDKTVGGLETPDGNALNFSFPPDWSDDFVIVKPDFNPLSELRPA